MRHINNFDKCGIWTIPKDYFLRKKHSLNFFVLEKVPINPPNLFICATAKYPFLWIHNITFYKDLLTQETSNKPPPIRGWLSWGPVYDTKRGPKRWLRQTTWQQNGLNHSTSSAQVETQWPTGRSKCSALQVLREMQIKPSMNYHFAHDCTEVMWRWRAIELPSIAVESQLTWSFWKFAYPMTQRSFPRYTSRETYTKE